MKPRPRLPAPAHYAAIEAAGQQSFPFAAGSFGGLTLFVATVSLLPTFLCLNQTYDSIAFVVRNVYQNVLNVYVIPDWSEPEVQRPLKARKGL